MTMMNISYVLSVCILLLLLMKYCCRPHGDENGATETVNLHNTLALCCFLYPMCNKQCYKQTKEELESLTCSRCKTLEENIGNDFMRYKWTLGNAGSVCKKEKTSSPVMTAVLFIILCFVYLSVKSLMNEKSTCLDNTLFELQNAVNSDQTCDSSLAYRKKHAKYYEKKLLSIVSAVLRKTFLCSQKYCVKNSVGKSMCGCLEGNQDHLLHFRRTQIFQHSFVAAPAVGLLSQFALSTDGHHDFCKEGVRLSSYKTFPQTVPVSTLRLAQAGFYYSGEEDKVVCFSCGVTHSNWQTGDRPHIIHAHKAPLCPFVRGTDTRNETLPLSMTIIPDFSESSPPNSLDSGCVSFASVVSSMGGREGSISSEIADSNASGPTLMVDATPETSTTLTLPQASTDQTQNAGSGHDCGELNSQELPSKNLDLGCAVYPLYSQMDARRRSFHSWQHRHGLPPIDELISLGFFYAGYADCVRCFFCGIGLKSWEPEDDPAQVHASWRPTCQYLRLVKGDSFVDRLATSQSGATSSEHAQQSVEDRRPQEVAETAATRVAHESGYTVAQIIAATQELRNMGLEQQLESLLMDVLSNMFSNTTQQTTSVNRETDEIDGHQNFQDENRAVEDATLSESSLQQDGSSVSDESMGAHLDTEQMPKSSARK